MPPAPSASPRNPILAGPSSSRKRKASPMELDGMMDEDLERDLLGSSSDGGFEDLPAAISRPHGKKAKQGVESSASKRQRINTEFLDAPESGQADDTLDDELALMDGESEWDLPIPSARSGDAGTKKKVKGKGKSDARGDAGGDVMSDAVGHGRTKAVGGKSSRASLKGPKDTGGGSHSHSRPQPQRIISGFSSSSESGDMLQESTSTSTVRPAPKSATPSAYSAGNKQPPTALRLQSSNLTSTDPLPIPPSRDGSLPNQTTTPTAAQRKSISVLAPAPPGSGSGSFFHPPHSAAITVSSANGSGTGGNEVGMPSPAISQGGTSAAGYFGQEAQGQGDPGGSSADVHGGFDQQAQASPRLGGTAFDPSGSASPAPSGFTPSEGNGIVMAAIVKKKKSVGLKPERGRAKVEGAGGGAGSGDGGTGKGSGKGKSIKTAITADDLVKMSIDIASKPQSPAGYGNGPGKAWRKGLKKGMTRADLPPDHPYHPNNVTKPVLPSQSYLNPNFSQNPNQPAGPFDPNGPPPPPNRTESQDTVKKRGGWPKGRPRGKMIKPAPGLDADQLAKIGLGPGMQHLEANQQQKQSRAGSSDPEDYALDDGDASSAADGLDHQHDGFPRPNGQHDPRYNPYAQQYAERQARQQRPIRYDIDPYAPADAKTLDMPIFTAHIPSKGIPIYKIPPTLKGREKELAIAHPVREQLGPRPRPWALGTRVILGVGGAHLKLKSWMSLSESPFEQSRKIAAANAAQAEYEQQHFGTYNPAYAHHPGQSMAMSQYPHPVPSVLQGSQAFQGYPSSAHGPVDYPPQHVDEEQPMDYPAMAASGARIQSAAQSFIEDGEDDEQELGSEGTGQSAVDEMEGVELEEGDDLDVDQAMQDLL